MPDQVLLEPCPFCGGPPVPTVQNFIGGGELSLKDMPEDGKMAEAYVFCHECGAQGGSVDGTVYDESDLNELQDKAVVRWQHRNARNMGLYQSGNLEGLNLYQPSADYTLKDAESWL